MRMNPIFTKVHAEIQRGMDLTRCRKCGCMKGTLENLKASLPHLKMKDAETLLDHVNQWYTELTPLEYSCLGCKYCIPPEAMTMLTQKYPALASATLSDSEMQVNDASWPPVDGEYTVIDSAAPVGVSTLTSEKLEEKIVKLNPPGLCIVGKTETENIGLDKLIKNVISNPSIQFIVLAGKDNEGHQSGKSLIALMENGIDKGMRIIGSNGRRPILKNVNKQDVEAFRKQVEIIDLIGSENTRIIAKAIKDAAKRAVKIDKSNGCGCSTDCCSPAPAGISMPVLKSPEFSKTEKVSAEKFSLTSIKLDKAGYFVILPSNKKKTILVEHYANDNKLLRTIEGKSSRDIYLTIVKHKWVAAMDHAAYLGKELARAEMSIEMGFKFVQDAA